MGKGEGLGGFKGFALLDKSVKYQFIYREGLGAYILEKNTQRVQGLLKY